MALCTNDYEQRKTRQTVRGDSCDCPQLRPPRARWTTMMVKALVANFSSARESRVLLYLGGVALGFI